MSTFEKVKEDTTFEATEHHFGYCPECDGNDILTRGVLTCVAPIKKGVTPSVGVERGCLNSLCDAIWIEYWSCTPDRTLVTAGGRNKR